MNNQRTPTSAAECISIIAAHIGRPMSVETLVAKEETLQDEKLTNTDLSRILEHMGFRAQKLRMKPKDLYKSANILPYVAELKNGAFVIVSGFKANENNEPVILLIDPKSEHSGIIEIDAKVFFEKWTQRCLLIGLPTDEVHSQMRFSFSWVTNQLFKFKPMLIEVLVATLIIHVVTFLTSIFALIVFDKVIGYNGLATLHTLFIGMLGAIILSGILAFLRMRLVLHMSAKMDFSLSRFVADRVMNLPLEFFHHHPNGEMVKKLGETSSIREFVTGRMLFTLLEFSTVLFMIPVLFMFSAPLTWIVIGFTLLLMVQAAAVILPQRRLLYQLYNKEAERQTYLVETLMGIETIKSLSVEKDRKQSWLRKASASILVTKKLANLNALITESSGGLQKILQIVIIWYGAQEVLDAQLTIGTLIAFNILSSRVVAPLVQLVGLAGKLHEVFLSVAMLGSVLNAPQEKRRDNGLSQPINGDIEFRDVTFHYSSDAEPILNNVSFKIPAGKRVAIVGPSGSGKSTVIRLLQGLSQPQKGQIRVDSYRIQDYDPHFLRSSIGVVLQNSFLFSGSVMENIRVSRPSESLSEVIRAARLSGAAEFIRELPLKYDTILQEGATNLSGGQRQRLSIARMILQNPRIIAMDEATSALDASSEKKIFQNLNEITQDRTLVFATHRLSILPEMDQIIVMKEGKVEDFGPHETLMSRCELYQSLWMSNQREIADHE